MNRKIIDIITAERPSLSFETFPPKKDVDFDNVKTVTSAIAALQPSYMSVTYGAGGGTSEYTTAIAQSIQENYGVPALAHLSCVSSSHSQVKAQLSTLREAGITNVLALRGDIPDGMENPCPDYRYASELVAEIRDFGGFCIGGACYPEGHPESPNSESDLLHLREKIECGCEFLTTQMFFDNNILYNFMYRALRSGIDVPVIAGIMPVTSAKQIARICSISKTALPQRFCRIVDRYGDNPQAMLQAGIAYATEQVFDLYANGINAVHIYTMNHPDVAAAIKQNVISVL